MGKVLAGSILVVVVVLLGVGDVTARLYAQHQLEDRIDANVANAGAKVTISSFPFLGRLAVSGTVAKIHARVTNLSSGRFTFDSIDLVVSGVQVDRTALFADQQVRLLRIDSGTVSAEMTESEVDRAVGGEAVKLGDGFVTLTVRGVTLTGRVSIVDNQLRLDAAGSSVAVAVPQLPVLPCAAQATVTPQHLLLSCPFHQIPTGLLSVAGRVAG